MPRKYQLKWKGNTLVASSAQNVKRDTQTSRVHASQTQQCHGQELNQLNNVKGSEPLCNCRSVRKASGRATRTVSVNECIMANVSPYTLFKLESPADHCLILTTSVSFKQKARQIMMFASCYHCLWRKVN